MITTYRMSIRNKYGEDIKMETIMERYRQLEKEFWELEWMEPIEKTLKLDILNTDETLKKITLYVI